MARFANIPIPYFLQNLLSVSLTILIGILASWMENKDLVLSGARLGRSYQSQDNVYDFIIIGGGTAGSTIAARLSEDKSLKILLIEAGGDPNPFSYLPLSVLAINQEKIDWGYYTVPLSNSGFGLKNRQLFWPRGKSLGGSSNANFMIYMRGNPLDFDNWTDISGDLRWEYKNVDKIFQRIEDYRGIWKNIEGELGEGGPLRIEPGSWPIGVVWNICISSYL